MATGVGPVVEIYDNRIEVTNPGHSLISTAFSISAARETRSSLRPCGHSGFATSTEVALKTLIEIEAQHLPAPDFTSSENSMRVVLFAPKTFGQMSQAEKLRACFFHCVWLTHDYMSNATLRERFSVSPANYQAASAVIAESSSAGIAPADPDHGKQNAKYVPYWVA